MPPSPDNNSKGWHSRGYLPHFDSAHRVQHVVIHLADSLPKKTINLFDEQIKNVPESDRSAERRRKLNDWMDSGYGSCVLEIPDLANDVKSALLHFDGSRYNLHAWVVMPNHIHVLLESNQSWPLPKIISSWKKFTARAIRNWLKANQEICDPRKVALLSCKTVWHPEYWDRYIRNEVHFKRTHDYIHQNPVKAGLVTNPEDWPWSSATLERESPDSHI